MGYDDAILPHLVEDLAIRGVHHSLSVFLVLLEEAHELGSVCRYEGAPAFSQVVPPLAQVAVSFPVEVLAFTVALPLLPVTNVEVSIVKEALSLAWD